MIAAKDTKFTKNSMAFGPLTFGGSQKSLSYSYLMQFNFFFHQLFSGLLVAVGNLQGPVVLKTPKITIMSASPLTVNRTSTVLAPW